MSAHKSASDKKGTSTSFKVWLGVASAGVAAIAGGIALAYREVESRRSRGKNNDTNNEKQDKDVTKTTMDSSVAKINESNSSIEVIEIQQNNPQKSNSDVKEDSKNSSYDIAEPQSDEWEKMSTSECDQVINTPNESAIRPQQLKE